MSGSRPVFAPGTEVRLKLDPGRRGVTTRNTHGEGDGLRYQVQFPDGKSFVRWMDLEEVGGDDETAFTLLKRGRFGRLADLRRSLTHIQLTGKLANLVYSMGTTNTSFYAYQFKPVLSFLDSPSKGLLIADEVGLGKTIEAGLIWTELRARYDARRLLVVCPAMLRKKWKDELAGKFSIEADILNAGELLDELKRHRSTVKDGKALICGLQGVRPPKGWDDPDEDVRGPAADLARFLEREAANEPLIDMVIIDESHYLRNPETQNAKIGQLLRDVSESMVLLSATPVNLRDDDLYHQLNLVDPDFFSNKHVFPQVLNANEPLLRAREAVLDKRSSVTDVLAHLQSARSHSLLANNLQLADLIDRAVDADAMATDQGRIHLANRIERVNLLAHSVTRTRKSEVHELRVVRQPQSHFVEMNEAEENVYRLVTEAIQSYAEQHDLSSGFLLASPQRQVSSCLYAAVTSWARKGVGLESEEDDDADLAGVADAAWDDKPLIDRLWRDVLPKIEPATLRRNDSKYAKFRTLVRDYLRQHPGKKMVVFSTYPGTLAYLQKRLEDDGVGSEILHGSVRETKQDIIARFRDSDAARVLLSSEVASEGVDLQFCRVLINYDLPWNPMKVEQRIGRIDRIGQEAETISILNLGHAGTIDHRIFDRLLSRLKIFERALGGMEAILGDMVKELTSDLLTRRMTPEEQEQRINRSALAIERIRHDQDELEKQASHMIAHGGYILEQVHAANEFKRRITAEDLKIYVQDYLARHAQGSQFLQIGGEVLLFDIRLSPDLASKLDDFMRQARLHGQTWLATGDTARCRFQNKLKQPTRQEEWISQFHPLIRFISKDLREREEAFHPLIAVALSGAASAQIKPGRYGFAVHRWAFAGLKDDEEIRARVVSLDTGVLLDPELSLDLVNRARLEGEDWLIAEGSLDVDLAEAGIVECLNRLEDDFSGSASERDLENKDRVMFQIHSAKRHLDRQLSIAQQRLDSYRSSGKTRLLPAIRGQIRALAGC